jgi:16S rRNA (cytosine967-C5)-methyltransferase
VEAENAYADLALSGELERSKLDARDRAFATDLVYGTLRWRGRIDHLLRARALRGIAKLPPAARAALRVGAYQILFSRSVPPRAAVDETVRMVRALGYEKLTGLANALLRRLAREREELLYPDPRTDPTGYAAAFHAHPAWIVERVFAELGEGEALDLLEADNGLPPLALRVCAGRATREAFISRLAEAGYAAKPGLFAPLAVVLDARAPVGSLPGFAEGAFVVQDEASQLAGLLVDAGPGERVLDLCAAPGGKTAQLAEQVGPAGEVVALDLHPSRLGLVKKLCARLGLSNIRVVIGDARRPPEPVAAGGFDRVLLDAPCTGLGVLRRNPDLRWRVKPSAPARLADLQREMLASALLLVRPGGVVVYSVCTFTREETSDVLADLLAGRDDVMIENPVERLGEGCAGLILNEACGPVLRTWPHRHGTDAFFAARVALRPDAPGRRRA